MRWFKRKPPVLYADGMVDVIITIPVRRFLDLQAMAEGRKQDVSDFILQSLLPEVYRKDKGK